MKETALGAALGVKAHIRPEVRERAPQPLKNLGRAVEKRLGHDALAEDAG